MKIYKEGAPTTREMFLHLAPSGDAEGSVWLEFVYAEGDRVQGSTIAVITSEGIRLPSTVGSTQPLPLTLCGQVRVL
jgi:hypothetical protein